ncbi:MAG: glutamine--tRNA ligase [Bacteroides sp.]|nr:MAG: glutamine--tRNA ligase [Bacteroides sp.]
MNINLKKNFLSEIIENKIKKNDLKKLLFRFPPEPNGYLHIGHVKSILINFGLALKYQAKCYLRFDDTNPDNSTDHYIESIKKDIQWLGFKWDYITYTSDYFDILYDFAHKLIMKNLAYVDDNSPYLINKMRGTPEITGTESLYRNRSIEENLSLFKKMKNGHFSEESRVLRAKIDMKNPNIHMRDPIIYRIKYRKHNRLGNKWCIYPSYDFSHGQCDSIEKIDFSICTSEFKDHNILYNWFIKKLNIYPSQQYEFARLNISYNILSKRKIAKLIQLKKIRYWNDPRILTISGLRNKGFTPKSIIDFVNHIGVQKRDSIIDYNLLNHFLCKDIHKNTDIIIAIVNPVKLVLINFSSTRTEKISFYKNRYMYLKKIIYIDKKDFSENPSKEYNKLYIGNIVKLQNSYAIQCNSIIKNQNGSLKEIHCTFIEKSNSIEYKNQYKLNVIHWMDIDKSYTCKIHMYDNLFTHYNPNIDNLYLKALNKNSLITTYSIIEHKITEYKIGDRIQIIRNGYFIIKDISKKDNIYTLSKISGLKTKNY